MVWHNCQQLASQSLFSCFFSGCLFHTIHGDYCLEFLLVDCFGVEGEICWRLHLAIDGHVFYFKLFLPLFFWVIYDLLKGHRNRPINPWRSYTIGWFVYDFLLIWMKDLVKFRRSGACWLWLNLFFLFQFVDHCGVREAIVGIFIFLLFKRSQYVWVSWWLSSWHQ